MPTYEIIAIQRVRSRGVFETETEEEALEIFRRESLKVDYSKSKIDHLTSGWNPKVKKIKEKING
jgi:hypothetical protein